MKKSHFSRHVRFSNFQISSIKEIRMHFFKGFYMVIMQFETYLCEYITL
jgi:hypothetical protein